jgi:hypothetical protein
MRRASKDLVDARVNDLVGIILDGAVLEFDLCEFVREKEQEPGTPWALAGGEKPLSYSQIRRYAARAERVIADSTRTSRKRRLRKHLARRDRLYALAVQQGDIRAALAAADSQAKLEGLFEWKLDELARQVEALQNEVEALKHDRRHVAPPGNAPAAGSSSADGSRGPGPARGPGEPDGTAAGGRDEPRPLAGGAPDPAFAEDVAPLFPPERKKHS